MNLNKISENTLLDRLRKRRGIIMIQNNVRNNLIKTRQIIEVSQMKKNKDIKISNEEELKNSKDKVKKINSYKNFIEQPPKKSTCKSYNMSIIYSKSSDLGIMNTVKNKRKSNKININLISGKRKFSSEEKKISKDFAKNNKNGLVEKESIILNPLSVSPEKTFNKQEILFKNSFEKPVEVSPIPLESTHIKFNKFEENLFPVEITKFIVKDTQNTNFTSQPQATKNENNDYLFKLEKDAMFIERMQFDVYKRHTKSKRLENYFDSLKPKIKESIRIQAFNRLIKDSNRRIEINEKMKEFKQKEEAVVTNSKKYKETEWKIIYDKRFYKFQVEKNKKIEKNRSLKEGLIKENEDSILKNNKKKAYDITTINNSVNKLYNRSKIIKEKIEKIQREYDSDKELTEFKQKFKRSFEWSNKCDVKSLKKFSKEASQRLYKNFIKRKINSKKKIREYPYKSSQKLSKNQGRSIFFNNICTLLSSISSCNGTKENMTRSEMNMKNHELDRFEETNAKKDYSFKINDSKTAKQRNSINKENFFRMKYLPDTLATRIVNDILNIT